MWGRREGEENDGCFKEYGAIAGRLGIYCFLLEEGRERSDKSQV